MSAFLVLVQLQLPSFGGYSYVTCWSNGTDCLIRDHSSHDYLHLKIFVATDCSQG